MSDNSKAKRKWLNSNNKVHMPKQVVNQLVRARQKKETRLEVSYV